MASIASAPEIELDKDDAKTLADAWATVLELHDIHMTPKQEAYALLMEAMATVYPPMFVAIYFRKAKERDAKKKLPQIQTLTPAPTVTPVAPIPMPKTGTFDPFAITIPDA